MTVGERIVYFLRMTDKGNYYLVPGWEISYYDKNGALLKQYAAIYDANDEKDVWWQKIKEKK